MRKIINYYVIIPAYNESEKISEVINGVRKFTKNIIVVDDGSVDRTAEVATGLGVLVLRHKLNLGKGAALKTGIEAAWILGAEVVVVLDGDGQHNPVHIQKFVEYLSLGFDIVFGCRDFDSKIPFVRLIGNKIGTALVNRVFGICRSDILCGFMAFTKKTYQKIAWDSSRYGVETEIVARTGKNKLKYAEVPIETIYMDGYKGVTILDSLGVLFSIPRWLFK